MLDPKKTNGRSLTLWKNERAFVFMILRSLTRLVKCDPE
jgi:hypothetical protein